MSLDGFSMHALVKELRRALVGGRIDKITQPNKQTIVLSIRQPGQNHLLHITTNPANPAAHLLAKPLENPPEPPVFCMVLRKQIETGRIADLRQHGLDRLLLLDIDTLAAGGRITTKTLVLELMGKYSNVIFTEDGVIIEALIKTRKDKQALRTIFPKEPYDFPPNFMRMNPFDFSAEELAAMMETGTDEPLGKWMLKRFNGMSTVVLDELAVRSGLDKNALVQDLSPADKFSWCRCIERLGQELDGVSGAFVYTVKGKEIIFPLELQSLSAYPRRRFSSIEEYLDDYQAASKGSLNGEQEDMQKRVAKLIEKQKKKIKRISSELKETDKMDTYKLYGDLLMIYAYEKHDHEKSVTVANLLSEQQEPITIPLEPAYSMTDNANRYYKRYTKMRNRKQKSAELIAENEQHLQYLYSLEYALDNIGSKAEIVDIKAEMRQMGLISSTSKDKMKREFSQQILTADAGGIPIWVGRNNRQNDFLTQKKAHPYDLWFHIKNQPGSHVILACHNVTPTDEQIEMAAQMAAYYSKARGTSKAEVDCALVRNVKKPAHAAPGFVVFENQTTYVVEPKDWSK